MCVLYYGLDLVITRDHHIFANRFAVEQAKSLRCNVVGRERLLEGTRQEEVGSHSRLLSQVYF